MDRVKISGMAVGGLLLISSGLMSPILSRTHLPKPESISNSSASDLRFGRRDVRSVRRDSSLKETSKLRKADRAMRSRSSWPRSEDPSSSALRDLSGLRAPTMSDGAPSDLNLAMAPKHTRNQLVDNTPDVAGPGRVREATQDAMENALMGTVPDKKKSRAAQFELESQKSASTATNTSDDVAMATGADDQAMANETSSGETSLKASTLALNTGIGNTGMIQQILEALAPAEKMTGTLTKDIPPVSVKPEAEQTVVKKASKKDSASKTKKHAMGKAVSTTRVISPSTTRSVRSQGQGRSVSTTGGKAQAGTGRASVSKNTASRATSTVRSTAAKSLSHPHTSSSRMSRRGMQTPSIDSSMGRMKGLTHSLIRRAVSVWRPTRKAHEEWRPVESTEQKAIPYYVEKPTYKKGALFTVLPPYEAADASTGRAYVLQFEGRLTNLQPEQTKDARVWLSLMTSNNHVDEYRIPVRADGSYRAEIEVTGRMKQQIDWKLTALAGNRKEVVGRAILTDAPGYRYVNDIQVENAIQ